MKKYVLTFGLFSGAVSAAMMLASVPFLDRIGFENGAVFGYTAIVAKEVTPELAAEGLAREIVHRVQNMRRDAGFDIADRIELTYEGDDEVAAVLERWGDYVRQETLAERVTRGLSPEGAYYESHKVDGHDLTLAVRRA